MAAYNVLSVNGHCVCNIRMHLFDSLLKMKKVCTECEKSQILTENVVNDSKRKIEYNAYDK